MGHGSSNGTAVEIEFTVLVSDWILRVEREGGT